MDVAAAAAAAAAFGATINAAGRRGNRDSLGDLAYVGFCFSVSGGGLVIFVSQT